MKLIALVPLACLSFLVCPGGVKAESQLSSVAISSQTSGPVLAGSNATYIVTVSRSGNGNIDIYLSASGLPAGTTASFAPSMLHFTSSSPTSGTATLTLSTDASLTGCSNSFNVVATDGGSFNRRTCTGALVLACAPKVRGLLTGKVLPGGSFQLSCNGNPNQTCLIQATTNLIAPNWSTIGTNTADGNGILQFIDTDTKNYPARFYRTAAY